jgi:hypothetical protein
LLDRYHVTVTHPPTGKRGRPRCPEKKPIPELRYAQVVKKKEGRRLVSILTQVCQKFSPRADFGAKLACAAR